MEGISAKLEYFCFLVDLDLAASGYTAGTHTTCNDCCVGGHTAADSQDTLSCVHTFDVLRRCLKTNKDNSLASSADPCSLSFVCSKVNLACCRARRCRKSLSDYFACL